jgi:hypothetical protein
MADTKFSALPPVTVAGADIVPVVQGGAGGRTTAAAIAGLATKTTVGLSNVPNLDTSTTANITDSANKRFITDAQQTVLAATSGTNTGDASTPAETTTTIGSMIAGATLKVTPIDADSIGLSDSAASNVLKKLTWANVKATLKTYFDTLYANITHTHAESDITNLVSDLAGKSSTGHTHSGLAPVGGTSGQVLKKNTATDYDYSWAADATGGGGAITTKDEGSTLSSTVTTLDFVGAGVVATGAGATTTVTIAGAGAAAMSQTTIDFGTTEKSDEVFNIVNASISATSKIIAFVTWISTLGRDADEIMADPITISVEPLAGSMNIYAMAIDGTVNGKYAINYQIG